MSGAGANERGGSGSEAPKGATLPGVVSLAGGGGASPGASLRFDIEASTVPDIGCNLDLLREAASMMRRMLANEEPDDDRIRTIWHRSRLQTELLSWEDDGGEIVRQELTFFGHVVDYRRGSAVKTGTYAAPAGANGPACKLVRLATAPDPQILDYASYLLRHVADRDYYPQYLLRQVNGCVAKLGADRARTQARLDRFSKASPKPVIGAVTETAPTPAVGIRRWHLGVAVAVAAAAIVWGALT